MLNGAFWQKLLYIDIIDIHLSRLIESYMNFCLLEKQDFFVVLKI